MATWSVYVLKQSFTRDVVSVHAIAYSRRVRAETRREAVEKCVPAILKLAEDVDPTIKFISIFCGRKGSTVGMAARLHPARIDRAGNYLTR